MGVDLLIYSLDVQYWLTLSVRLSLLLSKLSLAYLFAIFLRDHTYTKFATSSFYFGYLPLECALLASSLNSSGYKLSRR